MKRPLTKGVCLHAPQSVRHVRLSEWLADMAAVTEAHEVDWCDGSKANYKRQCARPVAGGTFTAIATEMFPQRYLAFRGPSDVARAEDRTDVWSENNEGVGRSIHSSATADKQALLHAVREDATPGRFRSAVRRRTMREAPLSNRPMGSPNAHTGAKLNNSPYLAVSMTNTARLGLRALDLLGADGQTVPCHHTIGAPSMPVKKNAPWSCNATNCIVHHPEAKANWTYDPGFGGSAPFECMRFARRRASKKNIDRGWLAKYLVTLGVTLPEGRRHTVAAAFPSVIGNVNYAMLIPPAKISDGSAAPIGDDIVRLKPSPDGQHPQSGLTERFSTSRRAPTK